MQGMRGWRSKEPWRLRVVHTSDFCRLPRPSTEDSELSPRRWMVFNPQ